MEDNVSTVSKGFDKFNTIFYERHAIVEWPGINKSLKQMKYTFYGFPNGRELHGSNCVHLTKGIKIQCALTQRH